MAKCLQSILPTIYCNYVTILVYGRLGMSQTIYQVCITFCVPIGEMYPSHCNARHYHQERILREIQNGDVVLGTRGEQKSFCGNLACWDKCLRGNFPSLWEISSNFVSLLLKFPQWYADSKIITWQDFYFFPALYKSKRKSFGYTYTLTNTFYWQKNVKCAQAVR